MSVRPYFDLGDIDSARSIRMAPHSLLWAHYRPIFATAGAAATVERGDFLFMENGLVLTASQQADQGTESANQETFHDKFAGIALSQGVAGSEILIATQGLFFATHAGTVALADFDGAPVFKGVDESAGGTSLLDQVVAAVATANLAVGYTAWPQVVADGDMVVIDILATAWRAGTRELS